ILSGELLRLPRGRPIEPVGAGARRRISKVHREEWSRIGEERNPIQKIARSLNHESLTGDASDVKVEPPRAAQCKKIESERDLDVYLRHDVTGDSEAIACDHRINSRRAGCDAPEIIINLRSAWNQHPVMIPLVRGGGTCG